MARVTETQSWIITFGVNNSIMPNGRTGITGLLEPDFNKMDATIRTVCKQITDHGYEIKSVVPLTSGFALGTALENSQIAGGNVWGGGYGFGVSYTSGVIIFAQKNE